MSLVGGGDPSLKSEDLKTLAKQVFASASVASKADIVGDGSAVRAENFGGRYPTVGRSTIRFGITARKFRLWPSIGIKSMSLLKPQNRANSRAFPLRPTAMISRFAPASKR